MSTDNLNIDNLDKLVSSYYKNIELKNSKFEALCAMTAQAPDQSLDINESATIDTVASKTNRRWLWQRNFAIAASALIIVFSSMQFLQPSSIDNNELSQLVSKEIALNHNKGLLPEFTANNFQALASALDKLDFSLIEPGEVNLTNLKLVGARYCSIHGQLATQIKLLDDNGMSYTLYQTQLNDELNKLPQASYQVNGVTVRQWQEAGLFFGLAKSI